MTENTRKQQSGIKDLIAKGREQGYLTYAEVNDHLPEDIADPEQNGVLAKLMMRRFLSMMEAEKERLGKISRKNLVFRYLSGGNDGTRENGGQKLMQKIGQLQKIGFSLTLKNQKIKID